MDSPFSCSICSDASLKICIYCTKDTCNNHLCHRCMRCSECCHCDMPTTKEEERAEALPALNEPVLVTTANFAVVD